jgi:putative nucleotidyltransferase with HDIG domain
LNNPKLEAYLDETSQDLPTVPKVAAGVIEAIDDPGSSVEDIRALIEQDPALAARVMKVSNSSLYSFAAEIRSLEQALSLLGSRTVRNLVMAVAMRETYQKFGAIEQLLWAHAAAAGPVCAELARRVGGIDPDEAFTVGLLHDVGKAALANSHRDEYEAVFQRVRESNLRFADAEREVFGFDHAELGAHVALRWELPGSLVTVIRHHHDADSLATLPSAEGRMTALVSVTTACLTRLGSGRPAAIAALDPSAMPAWQHLGLAAADVKPLLETCAERIEAAAALGA